MRTWILEQTVTGATFFENYKKFLDALVRELAKEDKSETIIGTFFTCAERNFKEYLNNPEYHETKEVVSMQNYQAFCQEAKCFIRINPGEYGVIFTESDGRKHYREGVRRYLFATLMEDETL